MRLGIFTDSYRPYFSGVIRSLELLRSELHRMGHKSYVFAPDYRDTSPEPDVFRFRSVRAITFPSYNIAIPISPFLGRRVKNLNLDIIHAHSPFLLGPAGARWAKRLDLPLVFTHHTLYDQYLHYAPMGELMWKGILDKVVKDFCHRSDVVIAPSSGLAKLLRRRGIDSRIEVIPTGISLEQFAPPEEMRIGREQLGIPQAAPLVITVGRLGAEKNPHLLLEAFLRLTRRHPEAHLLVVGDGPLKGELKQWVQAHGLGDQVVFTGSVPPDQVTQLYYLSDLFVLASQSETQGLVVVEAKACGLPVVSLRNLSSDDLIYTSPHPREDGIILDEACPEALALAVSGLLENEARCNKMSANAKRNAPQFSSTAWARRMEDLYLELIDSRRRSRSTVRASSGD